LRHLRLGTLGAGKLIHPHRTGHIDLIPHPYQKQTCYKTINNQELKTKIQDHQKNDDKKYTIEPHTIKDKRQTMKIK